MKHILMSALLVLGTSSVVLAKGYSAPTAGKRQPANNSVCANKARAIVETIYRLEWGNDIRSLDVSEGSVNGDAHSYVVSVGSGGKFDMNYNVTLEASGPQACYLKSLSLPRN